MTTSTPSPGREARRAALAGLTPEQLALRAETLKEGIYLIFAALSVTLVLLTHAETTAPEALLTLAVTIFGTVLAVFSADLMAHLITHGRFLSQGELSHALRASFGAAPAVLMPFLLLILAALTGWEVQEALWASAASLVLALVVLAWAAARRVGLDWWRRTLLLGGEAALALLVIAVQLLAHS